jgi:hypothetical protein
MMTLEELAARPDILQNIDWEMTPQDAFQLYQLKSAGRFQRRDPPEIYFFYVDVWLGGNVRLVLVHRQIKQVEEIAQVPLEESLLLGCMEKFGGSPRSPGQYPIDGAVKKRLKEMLGLD